MQRRHLPTAPYSADYKKTSGTRKICDAHNVLRKDARGRSREYEREQAERGNPLCLWKNNKIRWCRRRNYVHRPGVDAANPRGRDD